ncbi:MAG: fasciclin domain-containing protein [Kofleriaceae bacterium]
MKQTWAIPVLLLATSLSLGACKKKNADAPPTTKTAEGGSAGSAAAPTPSAGGSATAAVAGTAPTDKNLIETAKAAGTFNTFLKAVDTAGIADKLNGNGPFTVLAPTDDAFAKVPAKDLDALLADKSRLEAVLQYHVVSGKLLAADLSAAKSEKSLAGPDLAIDGGKIAGATIVKPDIQASNGVIQGIDIVLIPPAK